MIELKDINYVKSLQSHLRVTLETEPGKEVMKFLEKLCGWYDFKESDPNQILIDHGGRRIVATIKTLMELTPDQIVALTQEE